MSNPPNPIGGDQPHASLWSFYVQQARRLMTRDPLGNAQASDWPERRRRLHRQYMASMGLDPLPARCDLAVRDLGDFQGEGYHVTRLAWQMLPDCWATGLYFTPDGDSPHAHGNLPGGPGALPGVVYTCGHRSIGTQGYQQHGIAWARRGYACLMVDTIEQHDSQGDHHGLYYGTRHDWISLGYTAAGGELWNSIRALDVLASRPGVDPTRLGVTGISGGGAASFFLGIADDRVAVTASVAGVSTFTGAIDHRFLLRHCDCMYAHNPYGLEIAELAALAAPGALMLAFPSQDPLYHRDEYQTLAQRTADAFARLGCADRFTLLEYPGPHAYQPQTIQAVQEWFDLHLKHDGGSPRLELDHPHDEAQATIFNGQPPQPQHTRLLPELLTPAGNIPLPRDAAELQALRGQVQQALRDGPLHRAHEPASSDTVIALRTVGRWLLSGGTLHRHQAVHEGMEIGITFTSPVMDPARVIVAIARPGQVAHDLTLHLLGQLDGQSAVLAIEPRGTGLTSIHPEQATTHLRAGALVGLPPVALMVQDLHRLMPLLAKLPEVQGKPLYLYGSQEAAVAAIYHALFDDTSAGLLLEDLPLSHRQGGHLLGVLRVLDLPQALGLLAPRPVWVRTTATRAWPWLWAERLFGRIAPKAWITDPSLSRAASAVFAQGDAAS